jgi:hypothetical protein
MLYRYQFALAAALFASGLLLGGCTSTPFHEPDPAEDVALKATPEQQQSIGRDFREVGHTKSTANQGVIHGWIKVYNQSAEQAGQLCWEAEAFNGQTQADASLSVTADDCPVRTVSLGRKDAKQLANQPAVIRALNERVQIEAGVQSQALGTAPELQQSVDQGGAAAPAAPQAPAEPAE